MLFCCHFFSRGDEIRISENLGDGAAGTGHGCSVTDKAFLLIDNFYNMRSSVRGEVVVLQSRSHADADILVELAYHSLPLLNRGVGLVLLLLARSEDERVSIGDVDSELVVEGGVRALLRATEGARLGAAVREAYLLDLHRGEVDAALADTRLIKVVVLQSTLLAHSDVPLVQEDQAFLP